MIAVAHQISRALERLIRRQGSGQGNRDLVEAKCCCAGLGVDGQRCRVAREGQPFGRPASVPVEIGIVGASRVQFDDARNEREGPYLQTYLGEGGEGNRWKVDSSPS